jgi:hypothetical protein
LKSLGVLQESDYIDGDEAPYQHITKFSDFHVAVVLYVCLVIVCMKRDLTIFMKLGNAGVLCLCLLILFVIYQGIAALVNGKTKYDVIFSGTTTPGGDISELLLFSSGYSIIMGTFSAGFFIHQCSLPIMQKAAEPEKNLRNVFLGYTAVAITYILVGVLGYIGFMSEDFKEIRDNSKNKGLIT